MSALHVGATWPGNPNVFAGGLPLRAFEGANVLIVDDDPIVGDMYRLALSRAGFTVQVARSGIDALRLAGNPSLEIVLLDIRMPGMDGIEVLRQLAANPETREVPVVMLSNYDDSYYMMESIRLGAKEYLVKAGINPADLVAVIARWRRRPAE
jgi:DNA-binding response OmpR family regulator